MAKKKAGADAFPLERVRNIGIIAHIDAGKTTTTEQILYYAGKEHRIGTVDEGTTTTDWDPDEQARGITIVSAAVTVHWTPRVPVVVLDAPEVADAVSDATKDGSGEAQEHRINIIDTPGHIDFTAEVERSLSVLDGAIAIFCGVAGVQAQSETVWRQANSYRVPRIAFVNKLDRSGANFYQVLEEIRERLPGTIPLAVQIPIGEEKEFTGVVDLLRMTAWTWAEGELPPPPELGEVPEDVRDDAELYRSELIEQLTELDDELATRVSEGEEPSPELLQGVLRRLTLQRKVVPVLCGASFRHKGTQPLLDAVCAYLPGPADRPPVQGKRPPSKRRVDDEDQEGWLEAERPPSAKAHFCALAFKTVTQKTGDLVYLRVYSGEASGKDQLLNVNKGQKERLGRIHVMHANRKEPVEVARVGDILGVVGLRYTVTGDTLCDPDHPILLGKIAFPIPVVSRSVEPRSTADKDKLQQALEALSKDDPTLEVRQDPETNQTLISGMGELHLEIIAGRLLRDWKVDAKLGKPRVSYKATVKKAAKGHAVYDMTFGEKRQFAELRLEVERRPKVGGLVVEVTAPPEQVPRAFQQAIEEGLRTKSYSVGDYGDPLIDAVVRVTGGQSHPTDSSEGAFAAAASRALEDALEQAGLVFLEPIMTLTVDVPEEFYGAIMQDLQGRRAEVLSTTVIKDMRRLTAAVPLAEMFGYVSDIRSKSQGRATPSLEPRDYAEVPEGKRPSLF